MFRLVFYSMSSETDKALDSLLLVMQGPTEREEVKAFSCARF